MKNSLIWAGFGPVGSTERKNLGRRDYEQFLIKVFSRFGQGDCREETQRAYKIPISA